MTWSLIVDPKDFGDILDAACAGEEWALVLIYRDIHPRLLRYVRVRDASPEDMASDVWLEVATGLGRFRGDEAALRAWVFTIARRRLIDKRRMASRRAIVPVAPEALAELGGSGDAEEEALAALGTDAAIARLASLPADQAEVMLLRVLADLSLTEMAAVLGKRPGAVRALQHRALRRLARTISREAITK